jgi:hypothetical protein
MFNPHDTREGKPALYECLIFNDECLGWLLKLLRKPYSTFKTQQSKFT